MTDMLQGQQGKQGEERDPESQRAVRGGIYPIGLARLAGERCLLLMSDDAFVSHSSVWYSILPSGKDAAASSWDQ